MKLLAWPWAALLTVALLLAGCAATPPTSPDVAYSRSLLWQVSKDGAAPSYVFGTIHSTDPRLRDLRPEVRQALGESGAAAFELVKSPQGDALLTEAVQQPAGRLLEDTLGPELFQRTAAAVATFGVPAKSVQGMKSWALIPLLTFPVSEVVRLVQGEATLDEWLQIEARRQGKTLHGLESYQEQIQVFDDMSEADQVTLVTDMLADHAEVEAQYGRLFRAYLEGDAAAILDQVNDLSGVSDAEAAERFRERLIDDRNRIMVERMIPLMEKGPTFVAIGAGHLPGDGGVLDLLAQQGFTVTRLE